MSESLEDLAEAVEAFWLVFGGVVVFFMHYGFMMLEAGCVRSKNSKFALSKSLLDAMTGIMVWWLFGYGLSGLGDRSDTGPQYGGVAAKNVVNFFHSYTFAISTGTIISGGIAERAHLAGYLVIASFTIGWTYPMLVKWAWTESGWLAGMGYVDFAGGGIIHLTGATASLWSCVGVGPRIGRFIVEEEPGKSETAENKTKLVVRSLRGHSASLQAMGVITLVWSWLLFNGSSTYAATAESMKISGHAIINTLLSCCGAAMSALIYSTVRWHIHDMSLVMNSTLCGAVAVTCSCHDLHQVSALGMGMLSGLTFKTNSWFVSHKLHIDDALDTIAVHGLGAIYGLVFYGLMSKTDGLMTTGQGGLLWGQVVGVVTIVSWTSANTGLLLVVLRLCRMNIRVEKDAEILGLDFAFHDGFFYPEMDSGHILEHNMAKEAERRVKARGNNKARRRWLLDGKLLTNPPKETRQSKSRFMHSSHYGRLKSKVLSISECSNCSSERDSFMNELTREEGVTTSFTFKQEMMPVVSPRNSREDSTLTSKPLDQVNNRNGVVPFDSSCA